MKNILVTGACGYVGKALIPELKNVNLYTIDRDHDQKIFNQSQSFFCNDLNELTSDTKKFLANYSGIIVHLAAARSDDFREESYVDDNIKATQAFIGNLDPKKIQLFIHVGSVAAIDGEILDRQSSQITCSDDWYRLTKYQQQKIIESWSVKNDIPLIILAPSAIHDNNASMHSTNIGRLEKIVKFVKIVPEINVLKSLTHMPHFINAIRYFTDNKIDDLYNKGIGLPQRYLILDKPIMTITDICRNKFKAKLVIKVPKLKSILLIFARLIKLVGLDKKIPLSKERVIKLYKPTDYSNTAGYKEWINEET